MKRACVVLLGCVLLLALVAACGGDDDEGKAKETKLGALTFADHGTKNFADKTEVDLEADSYYFSPSFLQGKPGQKLKLKLDNESSTLHNISLQAQGIDRDVAANGKLEVDVTIPQSGALLFYCKYHTARGMNGELLAGDAKPQAAGTPPVAATAAGTAGGGYAY